MTTRAPAAISRRRRFLPTVPARYEGLLFVAPLVIGILGFQAYPLIISLGSSFTDWDGLTPAEFVGLDNYTNMFADQFFLSSMWTTILFTVGSIPLTIVLALVLAVLCNTGRPMTMLLFRTAYFTPYVTSIVAISLVWQQFYAPSGFLNGLLAMIGIDGPAWLSDSDWALIAVIVVAVWQGVGYPMVILLSGLQNVPRELYESARVDGAAEVRQFFSITLPLITPQLFFVLITQIILSFQVFGIIFVMTQGGPGTSTNVFIYYLFQTAFSFGNLGYASAMAWVMFIFIILITLGQLRLQKRWVFYG